MLGDRPMANLDLTFIGSGNAFAPGGLCWNGFVANGKYLFETPPSALMALNRLAIDPNELEAIVISHHHGDHFLGLPFLLLHWKWKNRTRPIKIIGPKNTRELGLQITESVFPGHREASFPIEWIETKPGQSLCASGLDIEVFEMKHDKDLSQCLGFALKLNGSAFAYTGDTAMCDGVLDLARSSPVVISECASRAERIPVHMNLLQDIPIVRQAMDPDGTLILTHINSDVDTNGLLNTVIAEDFKTFSF